VHYEEVTLLFTRFIEKAIPVFTRIIKTLHVMQITASTTNHMKA
jgi:hypothetical protein